MKTKTKKTLRKSIGIILTLVLILSAVPVSAFAVDLGCWDWEYLDDGTIALIWYDGGETNVEVPAEIDGAPVTKLIDGLFNNADKDDIRTIHIPASITTMDGDPFDELYEFTSITVDENNAYFKSVDGVLFNKDMTTILRYPGGKPDTTYTIPNGVVTIGYDAFLYSYNLREITIPKTVRVIESYAFCGTKIPSIEIPYGVTEISHDTFRSSSVEEVKIPSSVTSIGANAFIVCNKLETIQIPASVTYIDENAFRECDNLTSIAAEEGSYAATFAEAHGLEVAEPAPGADIPVTVGTTGIDPNAEVHAGDAAAVVSVKITWEDMEFTYEFGEWNTEDLVYDGEWVNGNAIITVENRSNIAVDVEATFNKADLKGFEDVDGYFSEDYIELDSALDGDEKIGEITFTVDGAPTVAANAVQLGSVTVIITGK